MNRTITKTTPFNGKKVNVVLLPPKNTVTPLCEYEETLRAAGYKEKCIREIIAGLANSPFYKQSNPSKSKGDK